MIIRGLFRVIGSLIALVGGLISAALGTGCALAGVVLVPLIVAISLLVVGLVLIVGLVLLPVILIAAGAWILYRIVNPNRARTRYTRLE